MSFIDREKLKSAARGLGLDLDQRALERVLISVPVSWLKITNGSI